MQKKAALYHRVSTADQDPTLARDELRRIAAARGWTVALDIEETGSGRRNDRPGLERVMEAARKRRIDYVVVWKLDRFGRSAIDLHNNIEALRDADVGFLDVCDGIELKPGEKNLMAKLVLLMLAAFAEMEVENIRERTRLGLKAARKRGSRLGRPPALSAQQIERVKRLRASGASWSSIAQDVGAAIMTVRRAAGASV